MATEDIIEAALASGQAFVLPPPPREPTSPVTSQAATEAVAEREQPSEATGTPDNTGAGEPEVWKQEYEAQVEAWRAQSAEAREKAEKERAKWEAIRKEETAKRRASGVPEVKEEIPTGLPTHRRTASTDPASESVSASAPLEQRPESRQDTNDGSQKWEEVQASTSSFPSMSFPERTQPQPVEPQPKTATLAIFDSSLSTRTRVIALFSALAINLALPFVNGVMLGFGEIFAKNVVFKWFGWSVPIATQVGINSQRTRRF